MHPVEINPLVAYCVLGLFFIGLALDLAFLFKRGKRPLSGISNPIPWGIVDLVLVILFFFFYQLAMGLLFHSIVTVWGRDGAYQRLWGWISNFIVDATTILFLARFLKIRHGVGFREFGLVFPIRFRSWGTSLVYYCASIPPLFFAGLLTKILGDFFQIPLEPQAPLKMLMDETSYGNLILMGAFIVAVAPFFEEIFFRGFLYPLMKKFLGFKGAMVASSALFAGLHFSFLAFLPLVCLGIFLAYLYEKTGSLFSSIILHSLNNLVAVSIVIFVLR